METVPWPICLHPIAVFHLTSVRECKGIAISSDITMVEVLPWSRPQ
jgi:hypothetical protein